MHGTGGGFRDATAGQSQLTALAESQPELAPWLQPLSLALAALDAEPWAELAPRPDPGRDPAAPLLHGARVPLNGRTVPGLLWDVLGGALGEDGRVAAMALDPLELLAAAVARDDDAIALLAGDAGLDAAPLAAAAQLAALPLLHASRRALHGEVPAAWDHGYCPVCGAPPALVEVRGLDRRRTLRCGRCGEAWPTQVLLCAFCGERDHEWLGSLVPEGRDGQLRWVETCASCRGYLKAFTSLRGTAPESVALLDASSLELDLAAAERGFARPADAGFTVRVRFTDPAGESGAAARPGAGRA